MFVDLHTAGVLLLTLLVGTSLQSHCNYDNSKGLCGTSSQCGCICEESLVCSQGPPTTRLEEGKYEIVLNNDASDGAGLQYLTFGWMQNFKITLNNTDIWTGNTLWSGKLFDPRGRIRHEALHPANLETHLKLIGLKNLETISSDTFNSLQRSLTSLEIIGCPKLLSFQQKVDHPGYPLPRLTHIHIEDTGLVDLDFLNSLFSSRKSVDIPAPAGVTIKLKNNLKLTSLGLTRPLSFRGENNVDLTIDNSPQLAGDALNICFLQNKIRSLSLHNTDCTSCDRVWLMALKDNVQTGSTQNNFDDMGYPYHKPSNPLSWSYKVSSDLAKMECSEPHNKTLLEFHDWPVDPSQMDGEDYEPLDYKSLYSPDMQPTSRCTFQGRWDPFMVHHSCFNSYAGWTSCLHGCDCSRQSVRCKNGPRIADGKTVTISKEDLPNLQTVDRRAFKNIPEDKLGSIEGFHIHNNPFLRGITADTSMFNDDKITSVIISKNPLLSKLQYFISYKWQNLEYLEMSHLGEPFSRNAHSVLKLIFSVPRSKLEVLDLSWSGLRKFPRIPFPIFAPNLRYLLLEGNKFTTIDFDSLHSFYVLPKQVDRVPAMLEMRTPKYKGAYSRVKTLNLRQNTELVCDCRMSLEHLTRVDSPAHWPKNQVTKVMIDSSCKPGQSTNGCSIKQEGKEGCVSTGYYGTHRASDLQCSHEKETGDSLAMYLQEETVKMKGRGCIYNESEVTFCDSSVIAAQDYSYFYCDKTSQCRPAARNDPIIASLRCETDEECIDFQHWYAVCPERTAVEFGCRQDLWECNQVAKRCQFKYPFRRSDYKIEMCRHRVRNYLDNMYWDLSHHELSKKTWVGDCGFRCQEKSDCRKLRRAFPDKSFCCTNQGFCSTNCQGMCPAGWTGELCETNLNSYPLKCAKGWGGDQCSIKLCNKFLLCANGATCDKGSCKCPNGYYGAECLTSDSCEGKDCGDPSTNFCNSDCKQVSAIFQKYKFASGEKEANCSVKSCNKKMLNSVCIDNQCACAYGEVALKVRGRKPVCLVGAAPCDLTNPGECSTLHRDMICSGNPGYIRKIALKPVAYSSYCMCSNPLRFSKINGACIPEVKITDSSAALKDEKINVKISAAIITVICLAVVGVATVGASFVIVRRAAQKDAEAATMKKKTSRTSQLASAISVKRVEIEDSVQLSKQDAE